MSRAYVLCLALIACEPIASPTHSGPAACLVDDDCDDGNPCTQGESCTQGACSTPTPKTCDLDQTCMVRGDVAVCDTLCPLPVAPIFDVLAQSETLSFSPSTNVRTAVAQAGAPLDWTSETDLTLLTLSGPVRVAAASPDCPDITFDHTYEVAATYPGPATTGSRAIGMNTPVAWATRVHDFHVGEAVDDAWLDPTQALGPAEGNSLDVVTLGRGGQITMAFAEPITDGPGADFAVFENGFDERFLELATVEVSTDGHTFARFDTASLTPEPVGPYGTLDPTTLQGFAGVYAQGFGVPFDLDHLRYHPLVRTGQLLLDHVRFVRITDVVGDGSDRDSFGRVVYDPFPTAGSAGFDLDAVGVLHEAL